MPVKAQHTPRYRELPRLLRTLREEAGMTQRQIGDRLRRPQSWVYNCESGNRRVDISEFVEWARACAVDPLAAMRRFLSSK